MKIQVVVTWVVTLRHCTESRWKDTNVSEGHVTSIFRVKMAEDGSSMFILRHYIVSQSTWTDVYMFLFCTEMPWNRQISRQKVLPNV